MCLILVAWRREPGYPLIVAANRDEFHARPSAPATYWTGCRAVLAGRDLEAGGTWLGVSRNGKFAAVTNVRGARESAARESRGQLVRRFLEASEAAGAYVQGVAARGADYSGFNLLAADQRELWWYSNRGGEPKQLDPGIYGVANELLDGADVAPAKQRFAEMLALPPAIEPLFALLSPHRIVNGPYGTRCATTVLAGRDGRWRFAERSFDAAGCELGTRHFAFNAQP